MTPRPGTRRMKTLLFVRRARSAREVADHLYDHTGAVARDMSKLIEAGLVVNHNPGKGRTASYQATAAGLAAIKAAGLA